MICRPSGHHQLLRLSLFAVHEASPSYGSSPAPSLCGGAQRGVSLATGTFTGESRRNPLGGSQWNKCCHFNGLPNHDLGVLDSFAEARESSLRKPSPLPEATLTSVRKSAHPALPAIATFEGKLGRSGLLRHLCGKGCGHIAQHPFGFLAVEIHLIAFPDTMIGQQMVV